MPRAARKIGVKVWQLSSKNAGRISRGAERCLSKAMRQTNASHIEPEQHHIPIAHDIFLAFHAHLAGFLGALFPAQGHVIIKANRLRRNKAAFKIAMNHARRLRSLHAPQNGPGARFLRPHGEIGDQPKQREASADNAIQPAIFKPE